VGNRLTGPERHDANRYNEVNELVASRRTAYQYDYNGNLTGKDDWTYAYDYENRLVRATKTELGGIKTVSFKYDPFGRRIEKRVEEIADGRVEARAFTYVYDNEDIILEYRTGADEADDDHRDRGRVKVSRFVHGPGIDAPLAMEQKGTIYYYHADGLGSIVNLTDQCGRVVQSYDYDSFGNMQRRGGEVKQPYGYTGREWDKELGLYYYRARYYDPAAGRFIGKDPIGFAGGDVNLYRYVQNNPVNWIDPLGLFNPAKGISSFGNAANAGRLYAGGVLKLGAAAGLTSTGVGAPAGTGIAALGTWNLWSAQSAWNRSLQQWNEAWNESWSDASWRNLLGVLPFGTEFDDPCEPSAWDVLKDKANNFRDKPGEIIKEIGTWGF
jgi:type VI secretion system secreted protein VgrG